MDLDLKGHIRTVQKIDGGETFGDTEFFSNGDFKIRIALNKNRDLDEFCGTLLHELLHVWLKIVVKVCKLKMSDKKEHDIIMAIEDVVMYFVYLHLKRRKA
jgi:hypothetical protein